jgi:hypothetical protein
MYFFVPLFFFLMCVFATRVTTAHSPNLRLVIVADSRLANIDARSTNALCSVAKSCATNSALARRRPQQQPLAAAVAAA